MLIPMTANAQTDNSQVNDDSLDGARAWFAENGLSRPAGGRVIGGVSAAFARRYRVHPLVARVITVAAAIGFTPLAYVALWVLMPSE
jgi:phage shock protein PspC (stress-responsive transcriptional regulator)